MIYFQGGLTLPEIPANGHVPSDVAITAFSAAAAILQRESQVAESAAAYITGSLLHAGSVVLLESAARFKDSAVPHDEPRWVTNGLTVLSKLGMKFSEHRAVFEGYAMAIRSLSGFHTFDNKPNRNNDTGYRDVLPRWRWFLEAYELRRDPELMTHIGEIIMSRNDIALLNGLYDRPDCTAMSRTDWALAACPYRAVLGGQWSLSSLKRAVCSVHPAWVMERENGRDTRYTLSGRGCAIVELQVTATIRGEGPYHGMRGFFRRSRS